MLTDSISVNAHSSIRIGGSTVVYIDPFKLTEEAHDADLILFTHPHYDHFSPEDFRKAAKPRPESTRRSIFCTSRWTRSIWPRPVPCPLSSRSTPWTA